MNNKIILFTTFSFLFGVVLTAGAFSIYKHKSMRMNSMQMGEHKCQGMKCENMNMDMNMNMQNGMSMQMDNMTASLDGKMGEEFDKTFISEMIIHHQGAVDMAKMALQNASHQEIKDLATAIIEAQEKEIAQMKEWQINWGY